MIQLKPIMKMRFLKQVFGLFMILLTLIILTNCSTTENDDTRKLRHVVLFKFKESASAEDIQKVEQAFAALPAKISAIRDFEWGTNNSPEGLDKGFTHCFLLTFHSEEDRKIYLPHPEHKNFGKIAGEFVEDVLVVDFWAGE